MRIAAIQIVLCALMGSTHAQVWGPPGATWYHEWFTLTETGYLETIYSSDTLINGLPSQKLAVTKNVYDFAVQTYLNQSLPDLFTTTVQSLVSVWSLNGFDTLYWFGAVPGDHWQAPLAFDPVDVHVTDTGTTEIDGLPLRYLVVEYQPGGWLDTLYERIGSIQVFHDASYSLGIDAPVTGLRCYQDPDITYSTDISPFCDMILGTREPQDETGALVFPNPGEARVVVRTPTSTGATVTFKQAHGCATLRVQASGPWIECDTGALVPGLYLVEVFATAGPPLRLKWIKQ